MAHNGAVTRVELTPHQLGQWSDTLGLVTFAVPGFRHLMYKLLANSGAPTIAVFTRDIPMAMTDNRNVYFHPENFLGLPLRQRLFVLVHEIMHCVYNDPELMLRLSRAKELVYGDGIKLPYDHGQLNIAMDYRINAVLVSSRIGDIPTDKWQGYHDESIATAADSVYDIYRKIYDPEKSGEGPGEGGGFDEVRVPGSGEGADPSAPDMQRDVQQWTNNIAVAQRLESDRYKGNVSADLQRLFDMFLKPQVPWTDHIQGFFARRLGSGSYSWRKPDRRLIVRDIYAPGRSGFGVNWVCVWGDTSGSIGSTELNAYFAELSGLIEDLRPKRVTVFWCDAAIKGIDDITDIGDLADIKARGVRGGGGTDCRPVFRKIERMGYEAPDALVCLTDGMATFPNDAPAYPVIWALTTDAPTPFGERVRINPEGSA